MDSKRIFMSIALTLALSACAQVPRLVDEYRIDVQQGNVLTQEMVAQLRPGLSRDQVRFILGTPLLTDLFHGERWEYVFRLQEGKNHQVSTRRVSVFFDQDGLLARIAGDVEPGSVAELTAPVAQTQVVDLGSVGENAAPLPPPEDERGFWGRLMRSLGW
jgi:outer membrane protein assembly factor BamE